jgi:predicted dehydrogenase
MRTTYGREPVWRIRRGGKMVTTVGVIGLGYWGPNLVRNFHQIAGSDLKWCCDLDQSRLTTFQRLYPGVCFTDDYRELLDDPALESVVIAVPARRHYDLAREALLKRKHVLVEKPLAMSTVEANDLIVTAESVQRVLMVGHVFEYNPAVLHIKTLLDQGSIGHLHYMYSNRVNLGRVQSDINVLWSIAPHDISIMVFLLGAMPETVRAHGVSCLNSGVEDVVFLTMMFPNNVLAHVQASWLDPSKTRQMTLVGSERMILYDDVSDEGKIKVYDKGVYRKSNESYGEFQYKVHSGDIHMPKVDMVEPLQAECSHFIQCIQERRSPRTDGHSGLRVVRVLEAGQKSLTEGGVSIDLRG